MKRKEKEIITNNHKIILHKLAAELAENDIKKYGEPYILLNAVKKMYDLNLLNDNEFDELLSWLYLMEKIRIVRKKLTISGKENTINSDDVNTNNLLIGMEIKDYQTLCDLLGEKAKTGKARIIQMENWKRFFDFEKIKYSNSYIILDIYPEPIPKQYKDYRNSLFVNEFKILMLRQLLQEETNEHENIIYHTTFRQLIKSMNIINNRFFNKKITDMVINKLNDKYYDDDMCKKVEWDFRKFYATVYRKLKDNIDYALRQLEKDNMIKINYYNVIFDNNDNSKRKATKDEEAKILKIKKETAELLGYKNSTSASMYAPDKYNRELQERYNDEDWQYVYYEIEIIANADNLQRHINEYTALNIIQNIYELSNDDIKQLQSKSNNNLVQTLHKALTDKQISELQAFRNNNEIFNDSSDEELKELLANTNRAYNNDNYTKIYNDFIEYLVKNNYN